MIADCQLSWTLRLLISYLSISVCFATPSQTEEPDFHSTAKKLYIEGKLDSALIFYDFALNQSWQNSDTLKIIKILNDRALIYNDLGDRKALISSLDSAFALLNKIGADPIIKATLLNNRAEIYMDIGEEAKVLENYNSALYLISEDTASELKVNIHMNLSKYYANKIHLDSTYLDSALAFSVTAVNISKELGDTNVQANSLVYQATLEGFSDYSKSKVLFDKAIELFTSSKNRKGLFFASVQKGLVDYVNGNFDLAISSINSVLQENTSDVNQDDKTQAYDILYRSYSAIEQYDSALAAYQNYISIFNTINSSQVRKELAKMEAKYELNQKDLQLDLLNKQISIDKQKQQLLTMAIVFIAILLLFTVLYLRLRSRHKILVERERNVKLKFELEAKSRELITHGMHIDEKNQFIKNIISDVQDIYQSGQITELNALKVRLKQNLKEENPWIEFKKSFEEIHPNFFEKLRLKNQNLSEREYRLLAFSKLGMNNREVSSLLHIEVNSVKTARYRLKKKLDIPDNQSIENFVHQM